tara:strand:- start:527 stop:763 length:237 start_codon:yes stop_codon:yes gene_type:complete
MRHLEYIGAVGINVFRCRMCDKMAKFKYLKFPHPAIFELMSEKEQKGIEICRKCARREIGSKRKDRWDELHETKKANT